MIRATMPRQKSVNIQLTLPEKSLMARWPSIRNHGPREALRAAIVLRAAEGQPNYQIAREFGISRNTVKLWRYRFAWKGIKGLKTRPIPGRPKKSSEGTALPQTAP